MDELRRILEMVKQGKLSAEEAADLIMAMREKSGKKHLIIFVQDEDGSKVRVRVPLGLVSAAMKMMPESAREVLEDMDIDLDEILENLGDAHGELVHIEGDEGETVIIKVE